MTMSRRGAVARLAALIAGIFGAEAAAGSPAAAARRRVAYHLSDLDKVSFALGNIANHIAGEGGAGTVEIVLVVNGPALMAFRSAAANADLRNRVAALAADGVTFAACGNTLAAQKLTVADLLPGFVPVNEGGVVRLARLQDEGYAYIRP